MDSKELEIETYEKSTGRPDYGSLWDQSHLDHLLNLGPEKSFDSLLDDHGIAGNILILGCGSGNRVDTISQLNRTRKVVGIDITLSRVPRSRRKKQSFINGDAENLPFVSSCFDTVISHSILHHLPQWKENGLDEIERVLDSDGTLILYEPGRFNPPAALRRRFYPSDIHTPGEKPFNPTNLERELNSRFESVEIEGHCVFSNVFPVIDNMLPFSLPYYLTEKLYFMEKNLLNI